MARQWTVTGQVDPSLQAFDDVMQAYMQQADVRNGALAVTVGERLVLAHGYTWDERDAATTTPTSLFRIASCTKPLTRIAIYKLIESQRLKIDDTAQSILALRAPDGSAIPSDPATSDKSKQGYYFGYVQVQHLLQHTGGWDVVVGGNPLRDPTAQNDVAVAQAFKHELPVSRGEIARWAATQTQFYPGLQTYYSNFGFSVLGLLIEALTGLDYVQHQQQTLFEPLGIQRVRLSMPLERSRLPGEVAYDPLFPSESDDLTGGGGQVPIQYGGENNANFASFGGLVMAAPDYARVLASYSSASPPTRTKLKDMLGSTQQTLGGVSSVWHGGALPGTFTDIALRDDGVSIVVFFNRDTADAMLTWNSQRRYLSEVLNVVATNTTAWPSHDLFPSVMTPPVPPGPERLHVFAVGVDTYVRDASWEQNTAGRWLGWWTIRQGRAVSGSPVTAVSRKPNQLDAFVVGLDGRIFTASWKAGDFVDRWSGWWPIQQGAVSAGAAVTVVSRDPNKLDIFVAGTDGVIYTAAWDVAVAGGWRGWWPILSGRTRPGGTVSAVARDPNKLDIFMAGTDGAIYTAAWDAAVAGGWRGWWPILSGRTQPGGTVSAVARDPNKLDIFVAGTDGVIYTAAWDAAVAGGWRGWWPIGAQAAKPGAALAVLSPKF